MTAPLFALVMTWHAVLILLLLVHALRSREFLGRLIAFDAVSVVLLSALIVLGLHRHDPVYLDIALVLAMLVFAQTLAAVQLVERRGPPE